MTQAALCRAGRHWRGKFGIFAFALQCVLCVGVILYFIFNSFGALRMGVRGVNLGGTGGHVPPEFGVGDANV